MRALRIGAIVVGAAALIATGIGAAAGAGLIGTGIGSSAAILGTTAGTLMTVGAGLSAASALMGLAAGALAPKPPPGTMGGSPTKFTINKDAGIPYAIGRTFAFGWLRPRTCAP